MDRETDLSQAVLPQFISTRAGERPNDIFLEEVGGRRLTYAEADRESRSWAAALAEVDVQPGDHVLVMLPSSCDAITIWAGLNWLGAIEVPVHNDYRDRMLSYLIAASRASVLVIAEAFVDRLHACVDDLGALSTVIVIGAADDARSLPVRVLSTNDLATTPTPVDDLRSPLSHEICTILFTSGTTGLSKGVLVPFGQVHATAAGTWPWADMAASDAEYLTLPLYHIGGKVAVYRTLITGSRLVLRPRFSTEAFWSDIRQYRCTTTMLLGTMARFLYRQPPTEGEADTPLCNVLMLPLIDELDAFRARFGVRVCTLFNQTETSSPIASQGWELVGPGSCGRARPGYDCRIVDEFDREVPHGEVGELVVRCDQPWQLMAGYLDMPEKTVEVWRNQWLHTGDAFYRDDHGYFFFVDRRKDTIRRRGENISSLELEAFVNEHPDVLTCAAVPVASEWGEDDIKVAVVLQEGRELRPEQLLEFLRDRVPRFMVPRYVEYLSDLPMTPTSKVKKIELREAGVTAATWDAAGAGSEP